MDRGSTRRRPMHYPVRRQDRSDGRRRGSAIRARNAPSAGPPAPEPKGLSNKSRQPPKYPKVKFHRPDLPTGDSSLLDIEQLMADPKWHPLLELMPDGVAIIDRVGVVRYMNSATEAATDVLRSEALDRSLKDFIERSVLEISFILETFSAGARTTRSVADRFGGTPYTAIARCVRDWQGNVIGMVLILSRSSDPAVLDASRNASHEPAIGSAGSTATIRASD